MNIKKSTRGRKAVYADYKQIPFSKLRIGQTVPVAKITTLKAARAIENNVKNITSKAYIHKKFIVEIENNNIIVQRTK